MTPDRLPERWTCRPATTEDAAEANRLFNERSQHFYGTNQTTEDEIRAWMSMPHFDLSRDTYTLRDESDALRGWAHLRDPGEPYVALHAGISVAIEHMHDPRIWDALVEWCDSRAREYIAMAPAEARVTLWLTGLSTDTDRCQAIERAGAQRIRVGHRMRIDLHDDLPEPVWPDGVAVRTYQHEDDLEALVAATQESFADHWGHVDSPLEEEIKRWRERIGADKSFDPSLWYLAVDGRQIAGFALCSPDIGGDPARSELDPLAVRAAWRRKGIGLALLHHAFREALARGQAAVELEMDSENLTGAARLYERAGMHVIRREYIYEKELRPGTDLVKRV